MLWFRSNPLVGQHHKFEHNAWHGGLPFGECNSRHNLNECNNEEQHFTFEDLTHYTSHTVIFLMKIHLSSFNISFNTRMRLQKEFANLKKSPYSEFTTEPIDENDMFHWQAIIPGPVGTPYEGGVFHLAIDFPEAYPFKPPKIRFVTKIFHPFVDHEGEIHIDTLKDYWGPNITFDKLLLMIVAMLSGPIEDDPPANIEAAQLLRTSKELYESKVREWTQLYAMEHQVQYTLGQQEEQGEVSQELETQ
ncbi:MAG: putative ubiquitin-protein ligase [Streblomastix strix]|uniref:Putative ubiquitin-protein ligase n=1 Tax=Streblomastix strix TaxID=222440 RepID=A0A5J4VLQ8_9EUKA|nr:MAG: putative ubiquitin-protein ligase [Streblomastix strix]